MSARRLALIALLPLLMASTERLVRAEGRLEQGRVRVAGELFRQELAEDPHSMRAKRGLARVFSTMLNCDEALPLLREVRPTEWWDDKAALAEGDCRLRLGDRPQAIAAFTEALAFDARPEVEFKLAMALRAEGDEPGADAALEALEGMEGERVDNLAAIARAWAALDHGGDAAWDGLADLRAQIELDPSGTAEIEADTIEGLLWLDEGDPLEAAKRFQHAGMKSKAPTRQAALRAESLRRSGEPENAMQVYDAPRAKIGDTPLKHAVLARIHVDLGEIDLADAELALIRDPGDPDAVASQWYVARARGDADAEAAWRRAWDALPHPITRTLDSLVPWGR